MDRIKRQFGLKFANALASSSTLLADLGAIREAGVKIRKVGGHCQAYSMYKKKTIYIGSSCKLSYQLIALAHEKVHVLDRITPDPTPRITGRAAFIDMCLNAETAAIVHEVVVAEELLSEGIPVDDHSMSWVTRFRKDGAAAIRKAMEVAIASNTGEKYPDYYGGWYDEALKPKDRLPLIDLGKTPEGASYIEDASAGSLVLVPEVEWFSTIDYPHASKSGRTLCPRGCTR